jgi:hypothetical protein
MWQTLERKQRFIDQLLSGRVSERSIEDVGGAAALTAAEAKALAAGNPEILEVVKLDTEIRRLTALESHHRQTQRRLGWEISGVEHDVARTLARQVRVAEDAAASRAAWAAAGERSPGVTIGGRLHQGEGYRARAAEALEAALRPLRRAWLREGCLERVQASVGAYMRFDVRAEVAPGVDSGFQTRLWLVGREEHTVSMNPASHEGTLVSLEAQAHPWRLEQLAASLVGEAARLRQRLEELRVEVARPFEEAPVLATLREQRDAIVERLQLKDAADEIALPAEEAPEVLRVPDLEPSRNRERGEA